MEEEVERERNREELRNDCETGEQPDEEEQFDIEQADVEEQPQDGIEEENGTTMRQRLTLQETSLLHNKLRNLFMR